MVPSRNPHQDEFFVMAEYKYWQIYLPMSIYLINLKIIQFIVLTLNAFTLIWTHLAMRESACINYNP
jgi:hypothetical protein